MANAIKKPARISTRAVYTYLSIKNRILCCFLLSAALLSAQAINPTYRFHTNVGDIDVQLTPDVAPLTVANFLAYNNAGAYVNTVFHRSVPGFIIQAGGYQLQNHVLVATPQNAPVVNEFNVSNTTGTIAMAKLGSDPNSATNQWFFNLANNGSNLDAQNSGFTVFGHITNAAGLKVMNTIGSFPINPAGFPSPFDQIPMNNYRGTVQDGNFITISSIVPVPALTAPGFESAASAASTSTTGIAPGEFLAIYGQNLGPAPFVTLTLDSKGNALNSIGGTQVLFDGTPGIMVLSSVGQVNVVAPFNLDGKSSVNVTVTNGGIASNAVQFPVVAANPAIFTLNSSGKGDAAIVRLDASIVSTTSPASPGDTLILFGEGAGVATPALADGTIVSTTLPLVHAVLMIDGKVTPTLYTGGAPSLVNGVLQVNFVVPSMSAGAHSIQLQVGDRTSPAGVNLQTK